MSPRPESGHMPFPKPIACKANKNNHEDEEEGEELDGGCILSHLLVLFSSGASSYELQVDRWEHR